MHLTIELLNRFLNLAIKDFDYKEIEDPLIVDLIKALDHDEKYWHVEGKNKIWRVKFWRQAIENEMIRREQARKYKLALDKRTEFLNMLVDAIMNQLGIDDRQQAMPLALKFLKQNNKKAMTLLGLEFEGEIPELPNRHQVWENGKFLYEY